MNSELAFTVHTGTEADVTPACRLWAEAVAGRDGGAPDEDVRVRAEAKFGVERLSFMICRATDDPEGQLAGIALAIRPPQTSTHAHLALLAAAPRFSGYGVGALLLAAVTRNLAESGFTTADLRVLQGNVAAQSLYKGAGWLPFGLPVPHEASGLPFQHYHLDLSQQG